MDSPMVCPICLEDFNDTTRRPRVLPCGHSFCSQCLYQIMSSGISKCSSCRALYKVKSLNSIPVNIGMERFIQMWPDMLHRSDITSEYVKPLVTLTLRVDGKTLGHMSIRLTCDQKRCKQMLLIMKHSTINNKVRFHQARSVGWQGERSCCTWYPPCGITSNLGTAIFCDSYVEGAVTGNVAAGMFWICTRTYIGFTSRAPEIGRIVSGLDLLRKVLQRYTTLIQHGKYDASKIIISDIKISV